MSCVCVTAYYKFVVLDNLTVYQSAIRDFCQKHSIKGIVLLAEEGINSTVAGSGEAIKAYKAFLKSFPAFQDLTFKDSSAKKIPFRRLKVRLKKEIVTLGQDGISPTKKVGTYVKPQDWNALITDPEVLVVDTRNDYEVDIGTFKGALDPKTKSFRDLPKYVTENLDPTKHKKVAMFCTGGIRCEKSTAYMLEKGFEEVYHLEGGILKYLEEIPAEESLWKGSCFVFDQRVAVNQGLELANYDMCFGCRRPIDEQDKENPLYEEGVSCPKCYHERNDQQRSNARQRHLQELVAKRNGKRHIGAVFA